MTSPQANEYVEQTWARLRNGARRIVPERWRGGGAVVPVVRLSGVIGNARPFRGGMSMQSVAKVLDKAFKMRDAKAVALVINSPGGSPVQSHLIYQRIRLLSAEHQRKVIAFVEDVAASGGYMIACAADEIVADPSSIVGSIGVVGATFGAVDAIKKLGLERRVYTSGEHKVMLDPFQPEKPEDVAHLQGIQREMHEMFIDLVKRSRGARLTGPEKTLFSGEYWTARTALGYGIVDQLGELRAVLRERFGDEVRTPLVADKKGLLARIGGSSASSLADDALAAIEERALWSRYGL